MRSTLWVMCLVACGNPADAPKPEPAPAPVQPPQPAPPTPPACEATIADAAKRIATESKRVDLDTSAERIRLTMTASCEAEAWPANVMRCIAAARLDVDLTSCTEQLPHDQYARLQHKITQLAPVAKPPTPSPPAIAVATPRPRRPSSDDLIVPGTLKRDDPKKLDCSKTVVDARNPACMMQYCKLHNTDPRCDVE